MILLLAGSLSCRLRERPELACARAERTFRQGYLQQSQGEAAQGHWRFRASSPEWAWRFRILEAKSALWRGMYEDVLKLLESPPAQAHHPSLAIPTLTLIAIADVRLHRFPEAERSLQDAEKLCQTFADAICGDTIQARGLLANEQNQFEAARHFYESSWSFAHAHGDRFLESTSLLNRGAMSLAEGHFDEAMDQSEEAYQAAKAVDARVVELVTRGNIAWALYKLGDYERALQMFVEAKDTAAALGDVSDEENELTNIGYIYMDGRQFDLAQQSFRRALELANGIDSKEDVYNGLRALARLSLQTGDIEKADSYAAQALQLARESGKRLDELYPLLVQGQVAARRGDTAAAEEMLRDVEQDKSCPVFLKWEAEHAIARLYEDQGRLEAADHEYRIAVTTFEVARGTVRHEDSQLSFLTNAARLYDDYVHFLVSQGKVNEALRRADHSRARALAEGLGLLSRKTSADPPPLNAQEIARRSRGNILFYWLGERQSYLWSITAQKITLFPLPPEFEIDAAVQRYRKALGGPQDVLESSNEDGHFLYSALVAPARSQLQKSAKVFIVPDGSLNNLNFETLLVADPKLHYWIEEATVVNASSLRLLTASSTLETVRTRNLLLVGNSVAPNEKYPELPQAATQMDSVAGHFPPAQRHILTRDQATPAAYLASDPDQFSYIHFVAHGTASRLSPLDSAIVLSKSDAEDDSFKLYARDIIRHRLRAELVTISACYGAGERAYSGEGLVGLSWAFLRAGAHNVIAALWEATDVSTEELMAKFYDELDRGATPDAALRAAKLSLLRGGGFRNPFYWAPFQLYAGS